MSVVLTQTSVGAERTAAVTWASILDLLQIISLVSKIAFKFICPSKKQLQNVVKQVSRDSFDLKHT